MAKMKQTRVAAKADAEKKNGPSYDNRRARFDYEKILSYEAGIVLEGSEVKSIRSGNISLNEGYARVKDGELWLMNFSIPPYKFASTFGHEPGRNKKLLLHKEQIEEFLKGSAEKGQTIIPWRMYFKDGRVKVEIALVRGKKLWDKRADLKARDIAREVRRGE